MDKWRCDTIEELELTIRRYGPGVLYRGQAQHYPDIDGQPSLSTSFQRQGCIPDLMIKWTYYANRALQHLVRGWEENGDAATNQAILQHYGFRSFFLDASGNPQVGAWFASHRFESEIAANMVEDCFEDPVWLRTLNAKFVPSENAGHLYLISQKALRGGMCFWRWYEYSGSSSDRQNASIPSSGTCRIFSQGIASSSA